jgi:uncharacterized lipoprotein YehR (DUF1307 family)
MDRQERILIAGVITLILSGCDTSRDLHLNKTSRLSDEQQIVNVALEHWFGTDSLPQPSNSKIIRVVSAGLPENVIPRVSGMKVVFIDDKDPQLATPDPKEHQIRFQSVTISGDEARLVFKARSARYHKWANVQYRFSKVDEQWLLRGGGVDM